MTNVNLGTYPTNPTWERDLEESGVEDKAAIQSIQRFLSTFKGARYSIPNTLADSIFTAKDSEVWPRLYNFKCSCLDILKALIVNNFDDYTSTSKESITEFLTCMIGFFDSVMAEDKLMAELDYEIIKTIDKSGVLSVAKMYDKKYMVKEYERSLA